MDDQDPGGISPLQQMVASGAGAVVTSLFSKTWGGWGVGSWGLMWAEFGSNEEEGEGTFKLTSFPSDTPGCGEGPPSVSETHGSQR